MQTVLLIDDVPMELEAMGNYLRQGGFSVIACLDASDALQKIAHHKPDVIVTDVVMPGMNGFDLCRSLKDNPETSSLPIVACTSRGSKMDKLWGMRQGIDIYITKPVTQEELLRAVRSVAS